MPTIRRLNQQERLFLEYTPPGVRWYSIVAGYCDPPDEAHRPRVEELVAVIRSRLHFAPPRFRQRIVLTPLNLAAPVWVDDADFDVAHHVHEELHDGASRAEFERLVGDLAVAPQDGEHPLWDVHLVARLEDGRAGFAIRAHHSMLDGSHMLTFAALLADLTPEPEPPPAPQAWAPEPSPSGRELVTDGLGQLGRRLGGTVAHGAGRAVAVRGWRQAVATSAQTARAVAGEFAPIAPRDLLTPRTTGEALFGREPTGPRAISTHRAALASMKAYGKAHEATLNDVAAAVVTDALRRLLALRGLPLRPLKMLVPVDLSPHDGGARGDAEHVGFMLLELPISEDDPVQRLRAIAEETRHERETRRAERVDALLEHVARGSDHVYRLAQHLVQSPRSASLALSNVRGPAFPVWLRGAPVTELYPVLPLGPHHDLAVGLLSLEGEVFLCLTRDPSVAPELGAFAGCLDQALAAIEPDAGPHTPEETPTDG